MQFFFVAFLKLCDFVHTFFWLVREFDLEFVIMHNNDFNSTFKKTGGKSVKAKQTRTKAVQCSWQINNQFYYLLKCRTFN